MLTEASSSSACTQRAAHLRERRAHPLQQFGGRRDRVGGDEAHAALDGAVAGGLVAGQQPARRRAWAAVRRAESASRCAAAAARPAATAARLGASAAGRLPSVLLDRACNGLVGQAEQRGERAEQHHVGAAFGHRLGELLERQRRACRATLHEHLGRLALVRVGEDQARGPERDLGVEALHVLPVHGGEHVEAVLHALDGLAGDAQHGGGLAAADLRARGAGHERVVAGVRGGLEQHVAGGHDA